ncbi:MAG: imelysin family protein [Pseudorhodobacter sp.]
MRLTLCLSALLILTAPLARADVAMALRNHILPGFSGFAAQTAGLSEAAALDCRPAALIPAYHAAFDAWMTVADLRIGPSETGALSVAFWPDDKGFTARTLRRMIAEADPVIEDTEGFTEVSIAARGLFALEMLLFDPEFSGYDQNSYSCALARAIVIDLAAQAQALDRAWAGEFADVLTSAGAAENSTYLVPEEAFRALYTQMMFSLELSADLRLGRPMGTPERPRPRMAEAWRSDRSLRNVTLAVDAVENLALMLSGEALPGTRSTASAVHEAADRVTDPGFGNIEDPTARFHLEILQGAIRKMHDAIQDEIGTPNGIVAGFNARDGD